MTSRPRSPSSAAKGVVFEDVDVPGLTTVDGIAEVSGNHPSKGVGELPPGSGIARAMYSGSASRSADESNGDHHFGPRTP